MAGEAAGDSSPREEGLLGAGDTSKPVTFSASRCSKIAPCSLKHWLCQEGGCFPRQQLGLYVPGRHLLAKSTPLTSQQCCELPGGASPSSNSQQPTAFTGSEAAFLLCPCCCPLFLERWGAGLSTSSCCHSFASPAKRALGCPLSGKTHVFMVVIIALCSSLPFGGLRESIQKTVLVLGKAAGDPICCFLHC